MDPVTVLPKRRHLYTKPVWLRAVKTQSFTLSASATYKTWRVQIITLFSRLKLDAGNIHNLLHQHVDGQFEFRDVGQRHLKFLRVDALAGRLWCHHRSLEFNLLDTFRDWFIVIQVQKVASVGRC